MLLGSNVAVARIVAVSPGAIFTVPREGFTDHALPPRSHAKRISIVTGRELRIVFRNATVRPLTGSLRSGNASAPTRSSQALLTWAGVTLFGVARRGERIVVGTRRDGRLGADDADAAIAGGGHRPADRGQDHLDHRHGRVPLTGVAQACQSGVWPFWGASSVSARPTQQHTCKSESGVDSFVLERSAVQQYLGSLFVDNDVKMRLKLELAHPSAR